MMGAGVRAGATIPYQPLLLKPGSVSAIVGSSGMLRNRTRWPVAIARILPAATCVCALVTLPTNTWMRFPTRSINPGPAPL